MSDYHLVCVQPFGVYVKGQMITDSDEVDKLLLDREHHFNRIAIPSARLPEAPEQVEAPIVKSFPGPKIEVK